MKKVLSGGKFMVTSEKDGIEHVGLYVMDDGTVKAYTDEQVKKIESGEEVK